MIEYKDIPELAFTAALWSAVFASAIVFTLFCAKKAFRIIKDMRSCRADLAKICETEQGTTVCQQETEVNTTMTPLIIYSGSAICSVALMSLAIIGAYRELATAFGEIIAYL